MIVPSQMAHFVNADDLKYITPSKEIKPMTFQLEDQQTLFLSNLARIDFVNGDKSSFTIYSSNQIKVHRTKLSNADEFYEKHYNGLLGPPEIGGPVLLNDMKEYTFKVTEDSDIEISGYAFINVQTGVEVAVHVPKGVEVNIRPTIFKGGL